MILKRQEKDNVVKAMYSSSTIVASIFNKDTKDLTVIFKNGGQYKYALVSETDYMRFETADSQGIILNSHIKKYTFDKLASIDTALIIKEIEEMKAADDKSSIEARSKVMLADMNQLIGHYVQNGKVDSAILKRIESSITAYNKITNPQPQVVA